MKKLILLLCLFPTFAGADMLVCRFTEPFITVIWDADDGRISYQDAEGAHFTSAARVSFRRNAFDVGFTGRNLVLSVDTTKSGSDSMSDEVYLYEGRLNVNGGLVGGCEATVEVPGKK